MVSLFSRDDGSEGGKREVNTRKAKAETSVIDAIFFNRGMD